MLALLYLFFCVTWLSLHRLSERNNVFRSREEVWDDGARTYSRNFYICGFVTSADSVKLFCIRFIKLLIRNFKWKKNVNGYGLQNGRSITRLFFLAFLCIAWNSPCLRLGVFVLLFWPLDFSPEMSMVPGAKGVRDGLGALETLMIFLYDHTPKPFTQRFTHILSPPAFLLLLTFLNSFYSVNRLVR